MKLFGPAAADRKEEERDLRQLTKKKKLIISTLVVLATRQPSVERSVSSFLSADASSVSGKETLRCGPVTPVFQFKLNMASTISISFESEMGPSPGPSPRV